MKGSSETQEQSATGNALSQTNATMEAHIKVWAEQICEAIKGSGAMPLANLARGIADASTNEVAMAVGWLARDGRISFRRRGGVWEIGLRALPAAPTQPETWKDKEEAQ